MESDPSRPTGFTDPTPIRADVLSIGAAINSGGQIDIFATGAARNELVHLFKGNQGWTSQPVRVPSTGAVEEFISYSSDVKVYDAAGALMVKTPVYVTASHRSRVNINGHSYFISPGTRAQVTTNAAGMLSLVQEADSISIPKLMLRVPSPTFASPQG